MAHQHHKAVPFTFSDFFSDFERPAVQDEGPAEQPSTSETPCPSVYELIWHASDSSVKPIVANRRIERLPEPKWDAQALPFKPLVGPCQALQTGCLCPWGTIANRHCKLLLRCTAGRFSLEMHYSTPWVQYSVQH